MAEAKRIPKIDPVAAKVAESGASVVRLQGYVGSITDSTIRLLASRGNAFSIDVPRAAVIDFVDGTDGPSTIYVAEDSQLTIATSSSSTLSASALLSALGGANPPEGGSGVAFAPARDTDEAVPGNSCKMDCDRDRLNCLEKMPKGMEGICYAMWRECYDRCRQPGGSVIGIGGVMG